MTSSSPKLDEANSVLVALHVCRTRGELDNLVSSRLIDLLQGCRAGMFEHVDDERYRCIWQQGLADELSHDSLHTSVEQAAIFRDWASLPILYRKQPLGVLLVEQLPDEAESLSIQALLAHYGTALANLAIEQEMDRSASHYCASLQSLEEGISLFQEAERDAIAARLIALAAGMTRAPAGALFALEQVGDEDSHLSLVLTHGLPESLLQNARSAQGTAWPQVSSDRPTRILRRQEAGGELDFTTMPIAVDNVAVLPLRYQGIETGLLVLCNVSFPKEEEEAMLQRLTSFGRLGAALLHRLQLEANAANERSLQRELQIAATIQRRLLPVSAPIAPWLRCAWHSLAANHIGGDYLDLLSTPRGESHAVIADASGHGIDSALLMSSFRSSYRAKAPWFGPAELCQELNRDVRNDVGQTGMFITMAALSIDPDTLQMRWSNAGHNPILLCRMATGEVQQLEATGPPLGFLPEPQYNEATLQLETGDLLLLYTDGVSEATNLDGVMYGDEEVMAQLRRAVGKSPDHVLQGLLAALARFTGRHRYADDVSVSVLQVRRAQKQQPAT